MKGILPVQLQTGHILLSVIVTFEDTQAFAKEYHRGDAKMKCFAFCFEFIVLQEDKEL